MTSGSGPEKRSARTAGEFLWPVLGLLSLVPLLWACRGAPLGTPVADDYFFLAALNFQPLDPLNSMGVAYYWRPLSRQLYFGCLGPILISAPWAVVLLHLALLLGIFLLLYRTLRH